MIERNTVAAVAFMFFSSFIFAQTAFISGSDTICSNEEKGDIQVSFSGTPPFTFIYNINGINSFPITTSINPYDIQTKTPGVYILTSFSDANSNGSVSGSAILTVNTSPIAVISTFTDTIRSIFPSLKFMSSSEGDIFSQEWNYGDNTMSEIINNPIHDFPKDSTGKGILATYTVSLIVKDENNCSDTTFKNIWVIDDFWIYIPNSFTPDYDQRNDKFCIEYSGIRSETFQFFILNREGHILFETRDPLLLKCSNNNGWNCKNNDLQEVMPGVYAYEIYFQDFEGWKHKRIGTIHLIK